MESCSQFRGEIKLIQIKKYLWKKPPEYYTLVGSNASQRQNTYRNCHNQCNFTPIIN